MGVSLNGGFCPPISHPKMLIIFRKSFPITNDHEFSRRWWQLNIFFGICHPEKLGKISSHFEGCIFFKGLGEKPPTR